MPVPLTYPGVYVEEISSGVRTITGVSTATTAFVGSARQGPVNKPTLIHSFADYDRLFGGLWAKSSMSFAVNQYFANGGGDAVIVRVFHDSGATSNVQFNVNGVLVMEASSPGTWANDLVVSVEASTGVAGRMNVIVKRGPVGNRVTLETIRNVADAATSPFYIGTILEQQSQFLRLVSISGPTSGDAAVSGGDDGTDVAIADVMSGLPALDRTDIFNLLCLPRPQPGLDLSPTDWSTAAAYCKTRRAVLLVDAPDAQIDNAATSMPVVAPGDYAALFYPRLVAPNPLNPTVTETYVPCGAVAGVFARTDSERGVWKAPAGVDASLIGVLGLSHTLTDSENGVLNQLGFNCLRTFPLIGSVVWGARTLAGADALASEWKYIPVRRTALYIEESLYRGLKWVVFEPNASPLWAQIRLNVGAFMNNLFRQGAFQGTAPRDAYFVKCDGETTTQNDINLGIVNILVGFAPLKPAEFVVIKIQQMAGQVAV
jgi:hypothetical protein